MADPSADRGAVLPYPGGEDQQVQPAQHGDQSADFAYVPPNVQRERVAHVRANGVRTIFIGQQYWQFGGQARHTGQPGLSVQHAAKPGDRQPFMLE